MPTRRDEATHHRFDDAQTDLWAFERRLHQANYHLVAGVDEAGRGPLAGPVVSAAVILPPDDAIPGLNDSKKLSPARRAGLFETIQQRALAVGVAAVDAREIDRINILQASLLAMRQAVARLSPAPDYLLIDGKFTLAETTTPQEAVVKGDARCAAIAAASIIAKVSRDRLMQGYHETYPAFGFDRHKGYPTRSHKAAIAAYGPCPIHRRSFRGVKEHLTPC
ncbi:MAG: ribonuclease HII [Desulfosarcinaceae bacterium]|nr:ribonuclease HII [Desulfosarcinaceae bacterium]